MPQLKKLSYKLGLLGIYSLPCFIFQVLTCALRMAQRKAYEDSKSSLNFSAWILHMQKESDMFQYWDLILGFQALFLVFMNAQRGRNFKLFVASLIKLLPYVVMLDRSNYARWLPVAIHDLLRLEDMHPELFKFFDDGNFVLSKIRKLFSACAFDQVHEWSNDDIRKVMGAILSNASLRATLAAPEIMRLVSEWEINSGYAEEPVETVQSHHEDHPARQELFHQDVFKQLDAIVTVCNPYSISLIGGPISYIHTHEAMPHSAEIAKTVRSMVSIGVAWIDDYYYNRIITGNLVL